MTKRTFNRPLDKTPITCKKEKSLKGYGPIEGLPLGLEITEEKRQGLLTSPEPRVYES